MIECRVLGPVELTVDGGPAPPELLWRKPMALLIYLGCSPRRVRSREHLVGLLWPDKSEPQARHSLNEALRIIRRVAGDDAVATEGAQIRLAPEALRMDLDEFERRMNAGRADEASALVGGEFLEGFAIPGASDFEDWLTAERARWRRRMVQAVVAAGAVALDRGDLAQAQETAERALGLEPLSEPAMRLLLSAMALAGERPAALERYARFSAALRDGAGTDPSGETNALVTRIRDDRLSRRPADAAVPGQPPRRAPLVGRTEELARLLEVWRGVAEGRRAAAVMVVGDSGLGKTRLIEELVGRARLAGAITLAVRALEADHAVPGAILTGLARDGLPGVPGVAGAAPDALGLLASRIGEWRERFPSATAPAAPLTLAGALRECLRAVAEERPVVVVVDDAQWADHDSLLGLEQLARDLAAAPLLVVFTAAEWPERPELDQLRARIPRDLPGLTLRLAPLGQTELLHLARWALPSYGPADLERVSRRIATDSAGHPLLVVELLCAVALGLDFQRLGGAWPEPMRTLSQTMPGDLPDAVRAALRIGFRRLSSEAQQVLMVSAVLPEPVVEARLQRATDLSAEALEQALDELEWQRWLSADSRGYSFLARIAREVVRQDMVTGGQRKRIEAAS
jgi:DNA-binding SARP family transcriptional activator